MQSQSMRAREASLTLQFAGRCCCALCCAARSRRRDGAKKENYRKYNFNPNKFIVSDGDGDGERANV